jgi:hypothetical protein
LLPLTENHHPRIAIAVLWLAVLLTVLSGAQYLTDRRRLGMARPAHA